MPAPAPSQFPFILRFTSSFLVFLLSSLPFPFELLRYSFSFANLANSIEVSHFSSGRQCFQGIHCKSGSIYRQTLNQRGENQHREFFPELDEEDEEEVRRQMWRVKSFNVITITIIYQLRSYI